jgi:hypothetical protein
MYLTGHFQNAYITRDIDYGLEILRRDFRVEGDPIRFEPDMILKTPSGEKAARVRAALVWAGSLQIELIEPVSGYIDHYTHVLSPDCSDTSLRFHHVCVRRDDYDAMQAEIDATGLSRAFEAEYPGGYFVYLDARRTLGHYLEYAWATPETWQFQGWPADRPV